MRNANEKLLWMMKVEETYSELIKAALRETSHPRSKVALISAGIWTDDEWYYTKAQLKICNLWN